MTLTTDRPGTSTGPTVRSTVRRYRGPALVAAALVAAAVAVGALTATGPSGRLDPEVYEPGGARALAELLRDAGVEVERAGTVEQAAELDTPRTTVVVPFPEALTAPELERVQELNGWVLVIGALDDELEALGLDAQAAPPVAVEVRQPACGLPAAQTAGTALLGGMTYRPTAGEDVTGCYASSGRATLLDLPAQGAMLVGDGTFLTNAALDEEGNAALALGLLAGREQVVFLLPDAGRDVPEGEAPTLSELLPDALTLAFWWGFVVLVVLALWRARRLGRVVEEPLPVVVRAAEAVEGRSRLYRAARARGQAAEQLRTGTRERAARRLGMGPATGREALVGAIAQRTGRDPAVVEGLLYGPPPGDDAALVRLADDLRSLETALTE
jgi:hypothetical protein